MSDQSIQNRSFHKAPVYLAVAALIAFKIACLALTDGESEAGAATLAQETRICSLAVAGDQ